LSYYHRIGTNPLQHKTIGQILKSTTDQFPNREAIVSCSENSRLTFAEVLDKVDRLSSGLLNLGLNKGDRVALWVR
jgi:medium-chain acyl-CoA ligase, mitochondrial